MAGEITRIVGIILVMAYMPLLFVRREHLNKDHRLYTIGVFLVLLSVAGSAAQLYGHPLTVWAILRTSGMIIIIWASIRSERRRSRERADPD